MLVLTRKSEEGFLIGDDIRVTVLEVKGGAVRLGIEAPADKKIYRQEVFDRICRENEEAAQWNPSDLDALSESLKGIKRK